MKLFHRIPHNLKKTSTLTLLSWLAVIVLFLLQYFEIQDKEDGGLLIGVMVLIFLFIALPVTLLAVIEWTQYFCSHLKIKYLNQVIFYIFSMAFVYGVGMVMSFLILEPISHLPLKMVVFVHIIVLMYLLPYLVGTSINMFLKMLNKYRTVLPAWLLGAMVLLLGYWVHQLIDLFSNHQPFMERILDWLF